MSEVLPTLCEKLSQYAIEQPNKLAWAFYDDKLNEIERYTYAELESASDALASYLLDDCGLKSGDRVILVFLPCVAFSVALVGCFKAGVVGVPVFPPDPSKLGKDLHHFSTIQKDCDARIALTHASYNFAKKLSDLKSYFSLKKGDYEWPNLKWIPVDQILTNAKSTIATRRIHTSTQLAFLQYTSGSTADPKGVMVSHQNLAHNLSYQHAEFPHDGQDYRLVSWLPQYHDMGLIGSYFFCIYVGGSGYFLSPVTFLKDPPSVLRLISKVKATVNPAPNFAYGLLLRKFKDSKGEALKKLQDVDLSSLKICPNAAEPIDFVTLKKYIAEFKDKGLKTDIICPCYGLAEHTLVATLGGLNAIAVDKRAFEVKEVIIRDKIELFGEKTLVETEDTQVLVSCGKVGVQKIKIMIVDPETRLPMAAGTIGEIWINSPSKALGYWNKPELTAELFYAKIEGSTDDLLYLRTGDTGFIVDGELYFGSRIKDLIIINGLNYYPQDIEKAVETCHPAIRPGCSAAFALKVKSEDTECVGLVAELKPGVPATLYPEIVETILSSVSSNQGLYITIVCLLKTKSIEKTTSGKISRSRCRKSFLDKQLSILYQWGNIDEDSEEPATSAASKAVATRKFTLKEVKDKLVSTVATMLGQETVSTHVPLLDMGLSSLAATELAVKLSNYFGVKIRATAIFNCPTLDDLSAYVFDIIESKQAKDQKKAEEEAAVVIDDEEEIVDSPFEAHIAAYAVSVPYPIPSERILEIDRKVRLELGQPESVIEQFKTLVGSSRIKNRYYCSPLWLPDGKSAADYPDAVGGLTENIYADSWSPPEWKRMTVYQDTCVKLCIDAATKAVKNWGQDVKSITHLLTTCTSGWQEPGIACGVIKALGMQEDIQKAELNFNGCFCGATCLRLARDLIRAGECHAVLIVACEVASSHTDWNILDTDHMIAQSLFADGAASMVIAKEGIWKYSQTGSSIIPDSSHLLGLRPPSTPTETSFIMTLSKFVSPALHAYFSKGHGKDLIKKMWSPGEPFPALAIHPGGPRILEAVGDVFYDLGWKENALDASFATFGQYGNLGSAAMLFVLSSRFAANDIAEDKLITMAFGPGVTAEWAVLERAVKKLPLLISPSKYVSPYEAHIAAYAVSVPYPVPSERILEIDRKVRLELGQPESVIEQFKTLVASSRIKNRYYCSPLWLPDGKSAADYPDAVAGLTENIYADSWSPPCWKRMTVYQDTCVKLCIDAATKAVKNWGQDVKSITHLLTTCTSGWQEPGIACGVIKALGMQEDIQKAELNFNGCFCGATCLRLARDLIRAGNCHAVLIVACEVASSHTDWNILDTDHMIAQSLFADGAASMVIAKEGIWKYSQTGSSIIPDSSHLLGLRPPSTPTETSFIMTLSKFVSPALHAYFSKGHGKDLIKKMWSPGEPFPALAIHPGGPRILEAVGDVFYDLGWKENALDASFATFGQYGNLGSAAMLFVLSSRFAANDIAEDKLITMAFGPGVTAEWAVLERATPSKPKESKTKATVPTSKPTQVKSVVVNEQNVTLVAPKKLVGSGLNWTVILLILNLILVATVGIYFYQKLNVHEEL